MQTYDNVIGSEHDAGEAYDLIERAVDGVPNKGPGPELYYVTKHAEQLEITFQHYATQKKILDRVNINALNQMLRPYQWKAKIVQVHDQRANPHEIKVWLSRCEKGSPPDECTGAAIAVWIDGSYYKASYSDTANMYAVDVGDRIEFKGPHEIDGWVFVPRIIKK